MLVDVGCWKGYTYVLDTGDCSCKVVKKASDSKFNDISVAKLRLMFGFSVESFGCIRLPYAVYYLALRNEFAIRDYMCIRLLLYVVPRSIIFEGSYLCNSDNIAFLEVLNVGGSTERILQCNMLCNNWFERIGVEGYVPLTGMIIPQEMLYYMLSLRGTCDGVQKVIDAFGGLLSAKLKFTNCLYNYYADKKSCILRTEWV